MKIKRNGNKIIILIARKMIKNYIKNKQEKLRKKNDFCFNFNEFFYFLSFL